MNEIIPMFSIPLGITEIPKPLVIKLVKAVYDLKEDPSMDYSHQLAGVIEEGNQVTLPHTYVTGISSWDDIAIEFQNFIIRETEIYMDSSLRAHQVDPRVYFPDGQIKLELMDIWATIQRPGDYNPIHTHDGLLAGTAFIKVPKFISAEVIETTTDDTGKIDTHGSLNFVYGNSWDPKKFNLNGSYRIAPSVGKAYIFPCWLNHVVYPFKGENISDNDRISIAWNFKLGE